MAAVPNRSFAKFVALYDDVSKDPFPDHTRPPDYERTATNTWRISLDAASANAPLAGDLLAVLGYLSPDQVPCTWLREVGDDPTFKNAGADAIDDALAALHTYSLVSITPNDTVTVHRVVQAVTRRNAPSTAPSAAIGILHRQIPHTAADHDLRPELVFLSPHARAVADTTDPTELRDVRDLVGVLNDVARCQRTNRAFEGAYEGAIETSTRALTIATAMLGDLHPETIASRANLAFSYEAAGHHEQAIALLEAMLDDEHVLNNENLTKALEESLGRAQPSAPPAGPHTEPPVP